MQPKEGVTRRRMLGLSGVAALSAAALAAAGCNSATKGEAEGAAQTTPVPEAPKSVELSLYNPTGSVEITQTYAPRLDTLDGKTIAFLADGLWEDDRTFEVIGDYLAEHYPTTTVINWTEFPSGIDALTKEDNPIIGMLQAKGVDAVIPGNAG